MANITWPAGENLQSLLMILGDSLAEVSIAGGVLTIESASQADLDAALATYNSDPDTYLLGPKRIIAKMKLLNYSYALTLGRYSQARQQLFHAMLTESIIDGLANRIIYIRQLLTWLKEAAAALIVAEDQIDLADTVEAIRDVEIDLDALRQSDPHITVRAALAIID